MQKYAANLGFCLVGALAALWLAGSQQPHATGADEPISPGGSLRKLEADVAQLKDKASDQSHVMVSVAYHFNNMWFAAEAENWPLAQFYWNETRSHLRWAVRVIPVRKDNSGQEVKLVDILQAVENGPLHQLQETINAKDQRDFVDAYKLMLDSCYACHKAADKPYLRPQIPQRVAEPTINFDPAADWPK